jgi:hypothetical protein
MINALVNNEHTSSKMLTLGNPSINVYLREIKVLLDRKIQKSVNCTYDKYH